jgi:hypothetical protein
MEPGWKMMKRAADVARSSKVNIDLKFLFYLGLKQ